MKIKDYSTDRHFYYEREIPWDALAEDLGVALDRSAPIGYNWPQRWMPKLVRTAWKFYPRLADGLHMEAQVVDEEGTLAAQVVDVNALAGTVHEPVFPGVEANAAGIVRMIHRLNEIIVIAGGVHLKLLDGQTYPDARNRPDDPGPELSVYCLIKPPEGDGWVSALRFCCLQKDPHMHMGEKPNVADRDPDAADARDPIGWCVREMSTRVVALLSEAGYPQFAGTVDQGAIAVGMREVEAAFRTPTPAAR